LNDVLEALVLDVLLPIEREDELGLLLLEVGVVTIGLRILLGEVPSDVHAIKTVGGDLLLDAVQVLFDSLGLSITDWRMVFKTMLRCFFVRAIHFFFVYKDRKALASLVLHSGVHV